MESLGDRRFSLTGVDDPSVVVDFDLTKLLPEESKDLFEQIRIGLAEVMQRTAGDVGTDGDGLQFMILAVMALPPATVKAMESSLFKEVHFSRSNVPTPTMLHGHVAACFQGLEGLHIYAVLVRAAYINFRGWWDALQSIIPSDILASLQQSLET